VDGLRELQPVIAKLTHNRVIILLANSMTRFLAQRALVDDMLELVSDRRQLLPLLQKLAIAFTARDAETAIRTGREILRRVTRLVVAAAEGNNGANEDPAEG